MNAKRAIFFIAVLLEISYQTFSALTVSIFPFHKTGYIKRLRYTRQVAYYIYLFGNTEIAVNKTG